MLVASIFQSSLNIWHKDLDWLWYLRWLIFYPMSILWKMAVFIEKPSVTSSNCYETMKNDSILMRLGTNVNWTIASVTACSIVNFLLPWQRGDVSKLRNITILHWVFFSSKLISKCFPLLATPWCTILMGGGAEKSGHFFNNIFQTKKQCLGPK
jgi:hypothetical protein